MPKFAAQITKIQIQKETQHVKRIGINTSDGNQQGKLATNTTTTFVTKTYKSIVKKKYIGQS